MSLVKKSGTEQIQARLSAVELKNPISWSHISTIQNTSKTSVISSNNPQTELPKLEISIDPIYDISKPHDRAVLESLEYPENQQQVIISQLICSQEIIEYSSSDTDENIRFRNLILCKSTYCKHKACIDYRISRARERLNLSKSIEHKLLAQELDPGHLPFNIKWNGEEGSKDNRPKKLKIVSKKLVHFAIGSNRCSRKELKKAVTRFILIMRKKHNYKMAYLKSYDPINRKKEKYHHFHIALLPETRLNDGRKFIRIAKIVLDNLNMGLAWKYFGFKPTKSILSYIAKRQAGQFGHKEEGYTYYPDIMSREEWLKNHFKQKNFSCSRSETFKRCPINGLNSISLCSPLSGKPMVYAFNDQNNDSCVKDPGGWYELDDKNKLVALDEEDLKRLWNKFLDPMRLELIKNNEKYELELKMKQIIRPGV